MLSRDEDVVAYDVYREGIPEVIRERTVPELAIIRDG